MVTPLVTVCVVTYNSGEHIRGCLEAVLADDSLGPDAVEVIVVDNASSDGTRAVLADLDERVRVVLSDTNTGFAEGNELASSHGSGRLLLLLNPDCEVEPGCLRALVEALEADPSRGAVAALMTFPDGTLQRFARRDGEALAYFFGYTFLGKKIDQKLLRDRHLRHRRYDERWPPTGVEAYDTVAAACVLVRRPAGELFDPDFPIFFNDMDLFARLRAQGLSVVVEPAAQARHIYGATVSSLPGMAYQAEILATLFRYAAKRWSPLQRALWALLFTVDVGLCALLWPTRWAGEVRPQLRSELGALGLPGGVRPWLARPLLRGRRSDAPGLSQR